MYFASMLRGFENSITAFACAIGTLLRGDDMTQIIYTLCTCVCHGKVASNSWRGRASRTASFMICLLSQKSKK